MEKKAESHRKAAWLSGVKNIKFWYITGGVIFLIGLIASGYMLQKADKDIVVICQDGEILYRLDLTDYSEPETIEITCDGGMNTILIENGKIRISDADCPDHTCVKMGYLKSTALPIVCLPHRLVIRYESDSKAELDAMTN